MSTKAELATLIDETLKWKSRFGEQSPIALALQKHADVFQEFSDRLDAVVVSDAMVKRALDACTAWSAAWAEAQPFRIHAYTEDEAKGTAMGAMRAALESVLPIADEHDVDLVPDAKRYRWLRSKAAANQYEHPIVVSQSLINGERMVYIGPMLGFPLDTAIDRAIASAKGDDR